MDSDDREWTEYRNSFAEVYDVSNYASPMQSWVMRAGHRMLERAYGEDVHFDRVIEVGAGTGEHVCFVRHEFGQYVLTDLDNRALEAARRKLNAIDDGRLAFEVQSANPLTYPDDSFDRLIATHVLEHLYQPHLALKEWKRVIRNGGVISVLIPTDPGLAWRLGRHLGPRRNAIRRGIAYDYVMAREHVNSCVNLVAFLRHYFPAGKEAWWPLALPSVDMNLFFAFHAVVDKRRAG